MSHRTTDRPQISPIYIIKMCHSLCLSCTFSCRELEIDLACFQNRPYRPYSHFLKQGQLYHNLGHTIQKMYIYAMYACAFLTCSELSALVQLPMSQCMCENLTMLASCVYLCINICFNFKNYIIIQP